MFAEQQTKVSYANNTKTGDIKSGSQQQPTGFRRDESGTTPEHRIEGWSVAPWQQQ